MNPDEIVALARYVRALCPQQKFDEYTPDAWDDVLADCDLDDARTAAARVAARQPFVAPAEIRAAVRALRDERLEGFAYVPVPGDEDPAVYLAAVRDQREAVGSGRRPADPYRTGLLAGGPHPALARALPAVGRRIPDGTPAPEHTPGPFTVRCPKCHAPVGRHCRWPNGVRRPTHGARKRIADGEPAADPQTAGVEEARRQAAREALARLTPEQRAQLDDMRRDLADGSAS